MRRARLARAAASTSAVDAWKNMGLALDAEVLLLARVDAPGAAGETEARTVLTCFEESGAAFAAVSEDEDEGLSEDEDVSEIETTSEWDEEAEARRRGD